MTVDAYLVKKVDSENLHNDQINNSSYDIEKTGAVISKTSVPIVNEEKSVTVTFPPILPGTEFAVYVEIKDNKDKVKYRNEMINIWNEWYPVLNYTTAQAGTNDVSVKLKKRETLTLKPDETLGQGGKR